MCQQVRVEEVELTYRAYQKVHNYKGGSFRLRPILITATATSLGLVPMLLSKGIGSEVQKPLALVVIGGIFTSTLLTLLILPSVYERFCVKIEKDEDQR
jgi:Cu/Ag efflux pump CusA